VTARAIVVAGAASGVGKTTVTLGLLEAYRRRGLRVQAFKVGPDFIDPGFHALVTGRPSYNLDGWMCGRDAVLSCVARHGADADLVVVEGVMGCFDGLDGESEDGSTAQIAKWLAAPVVLVIDAGRLSRSAGAVALGFERFDPALEVAAVIANGVGGVTHGEWVLGAIARACRAVPLGALPHDATLTLPERHLGLVTAGEGTFDGARRARLAAAIETSIDLDRLLALARPLSLPPALARHRARGGRDTRIGVARDAAFQFYYAENLDLLEAAGATLVPWSPLGDRDVPDVDGLYLGGGYPELHAATLSDNAGVRRQLGEFAAAGKPVYAECGGLMFLARALEDAAGAARPMVGVLPATVSMRPPRMTLAYTEVVFTADTPLGKAGTTARGHEFHFSTMTEPEGVARAYRVRAAGAVHASAGAERPEGYLVGRTLMSYVHLHFASNPDLATAFVRACAEARA
jgi:cobyrinic acid a,c-diamide synthase